MSRPNYKTQTDDVAWARGVRKVVQEQPEPYGPPLPRHIANARAHAYKGGCPDCPDDADVLLGNAQPCRFGSAA